jgi:hypothetical protein
MALLSKAEILGASDIRTETVAVPEWGGEVLVRGMTGTERDAYEQAMIEQRRSTGRTISLENARARLCAYTIIGEDGKRLFREQEIEALGAKCASALDRVYQTAARLSGLRGEDVEELRKNSPTGHSAGSTSD